MLTPNLKLSDLFHRVDTTTYAIVKNERVEGAFTSKINAALLRINDNISIIKYSGDWEDLIPLYSLNGGNKISDGFYAKWIFRGFNFNMIPSVNADVIFYTNDNPDCFQPDSIPHSIFINGSPDINKIWLLEPANPTIPNSADTYALVLSVYYPKLEEYYGDNPEITERPMEWLKVKPIITIQPSIIIQ